MRGYSEDGMVELFENMHKLAHRDFKRGEGKHFYSAAKYFAERGRLADVCREHHVDYDTTRAMLDAAEAGQRR